MSYRMFRSGVTIAILALAVAFLVHMLTHGLLTHQAEVSAYGELIRHRELGQQITRLTTPDSKAAIIHNLAVRDVRRLGEYRKWAAAGAHQFEAAEQAAVRLSKASQFLAGLPVASHAVLLGDFTIEELFDRLSEPAQFERFLRQMRQLGVQPPLGSNAEFEKLVTLERPALQQMVSAIQEGHARAIESLKGAYPGRTPVDLAADPAAGFVHTVRSQGFVLEAESLPELQAFARRSQDFKTINQLILVPDSRAKIARDTGIPLGDLSFDAIMTYIEQDEDRAIWFSDILRTAKAPARLNADRLQYLAERHVREGKLHAAIGEEVPEPSAGLFGMSTRSRWLIALSFLVCVVGVANAMLMSVTERFTEIATMKCLGAMDRFVMLMFVFEAVIQGVIGGMIGLVLGVLLAVLRAAVELGSLISGGFGATLQIALGMLLSLVVGMILAALAAVGPSWIAARLAPMEAMRVD